MDPDHQGGKASPEAFERVVLAGPPSPFWWLVLAFCGLIAFLILTDGATKGSVREISIFAVVSSVAGLLGVRRLYPTRESSASFLFILCFSVFNLGLAPFVVFGIGIPTFGLNPYDTSWLYSAAFPRAMGLATIGLLALLVGTTLGRVLGRREIGERDGLRSGQERDASALPLGLPAAALMAITVLSFFAIGLSHGGFGVFTSGYARWLNATQGTPLPYVYALIAFATGMLAISSKSWARRVGFSFFVLYAIPALLIGLRAEVLFPLVSAIVMGAFRSPFLNGRRFLAVLIVALLAVSGIRSFRDIGFADATSASSPATGVSFNVFDGLAEMGYSLRPTVVVLQWQEEGLPLLDGGSFESPFIRLARDAVPLLGRNAPAKSDPDILNSVVLQRVGPIGFSQPAEGYDNWGTSGVIVLLLLIGLILSWIDRSPLRISSRLIRNSVFVPLLLEVRNTFTPVPAEILLGLAVSVLMLAFARHQVALSAADNRSFGPFSITAAGENGVGSVSGG